MTFEEMRLQATDAYYTSQCEAGELNSRHMDSNEVSFSNGIDWVLNNLESVPRVKELVEVMQHPDIKELDCDCGFYGALEHTCVKCSMSLALEKFKGS